MPNKKWDFSTILFHFSETVHMAWFKRTVDIIPRAKFLDLQIILTLLYKSIGEKQTSVCP